jgi:hypothetical protein
MSGKPLVRLCVVTLLGGAVACGCGAGAPTTSASARILYVSGAANLGVRTIRADGSGLLVLTTHPRAGELPAWVDHGRAISFSASDGGLWVAPTSGGAARRVARVSDDSTLSPSGKKVATVAGHLTITDSHGRTLRSVPLELDGGDGFDSPESTAWTPDERRVAFQVLSSDCVGRIVVVDLASGRIQTIRARLDRQRSARVVSRRPHARVRRHAVTLVLPGGSVCEPCRRERQNPARPGRVVLRMVPGRPARRIRADDGYRCRPWSGKHLRRSGHRRYRTSDRSRAVDLRARLVARQSAPRLLRRRRHLRRPPRGRHEAPHAT